MHGTQAPAAWRIPARARLLLIGVAGIGVAGLGASLIHATAGFGDARLDHVFTAYVYPSLYLCPAFLCFGRVTLVRRERVTWAAIGTAFLLWALGWLYYGAHLSGDASPPYPSLADALWLSFYPLLYAGLVMLIRARAPGFRRGIWIDGILGALALGSIGAAFLVDPLMESSGGHLGAVATSLAYPVGDLALLALVGTVMALTAVRPGIEWSLIGGALLLQVGADSVYVHEVTQGTWAPGTLLDTVWLAGSLLLALAAWCRPSRVRALNVERWMAALFPAAFTVVALAVLVYGNIDQNLSLAATALATLAIVAGIARTGLTLREQQTLRVAVRRDPLSGLLNHGAFHLAIEEEIVSRPDGEDGFAVVVLDLDGFKQVNDRRGHPEGDRVLTEVATAIRVGCRAGDVTGRVGGDEFGVALPGLDAKSAVAVAERIRCLVEERDLGVGISYGIAEWPGDGPGKDALLMRADVALYTAKAKASEARDDPRDERGSEERAQLEAYANDVRESFGRELRGTQELEASYLATVKSLAAAVEAKDEYTGGHIQRVHALGLLLARAMVPADADDPQLSYGLLLHDVGKLSVPDAVLNKPGRLTESEWDLMRSHPDEGARILSSIPFLGRALDIVRHHHERWDGAGYPSGLAGDEIPLWARLFAVVDTVDAITSDRPYRARQPLEEALTQLRQGAGTQFDPACVRAFASLDPSEVEALLQRCKEAAGHAPVTA